MLAVEIFTQRATSVLKCQSQQYGSRGHLEIYILFSFFKENMTQHFMWKYFLLDSLEILSYYSLKY